MNAKMNRLRRNPCDLEDRLTPFVVTNIQDYNPDLYDGGDPLTYIDGSLRYEIQEAMEKGGGTITFHPDVFGGPPDATNTIVLQYGEIRITDFNDQKFHFESITIKGPRADNPDAYHVHVVVPDDAKALADRKSVIDIESLQTPVLKTAQGKPYTDTYHAIYDTVNLIGLHLSGGTTGNDQPEGAGIHYRISNSTLSGNRPVYGIGGGLWVQPGTAPYSFTEVNGDAFDVDVNERTISFKGFSVIGDPNLIPFPTFPGLTRLEIHNTTIFKNVANGKANETKYGHGGGIAIGPDNPLLINDTVFVDSTIVAQNEIFPTTGFGTDLYSSTGRFPFAGGRQLSTDGLRFGDRERLEIVARRQR